MKHEAVNLSKYGFSIIQIETMSICDMNCTFCAYPLREDKGRVLPEETVLNLIDSLSIDDKFEYITFSHFNEPLLDKRIYKFIKHAANQKIPVMIITNGLSFNSKDVIYKLLDADPTYIKLSVQTLNPQLFLSSRGINYSFQKYKDGIFEFLKNARDSRSRITVDVACNFLSGIRKFKTSLFGLEQGDPSVYNTIDDLRADLKSFLDELQDYTDGSIASDKDIGVYLDKVDSDYLTEPGFEIEENISIKVKEFIYGKKLTEFYPIKVDVKCPSRILGILASGSVVPCCLAYDDLLSMGNVKKDTLGTILERNTDLFHNIREGINLPLVCRRCLGAPTKRGAIVRRIKHELLNR